MRFTRLMNSPALLITDCLQHDFVGPVSRFDGLPNALHVGHEESRRLLGPNPAEGPVARLVAWAHRQPDAVLQVIHVRDWHDPDNAAQQPHLGQFGAHCVRDTPGAAFVFALDDIAAGKRLSIVDATTLTNFVDTRLGEVLAPHAQENLRVGLMGVWTEAKLTFLAYDLRARYPQFQIAVCSALSASSSRENHLIALDQMERLLGVRVLDSVAEFVEFLGGHLEDAPLIGFSDKHPRVEVAAGSPPLSASDLQLVRYLFRGCREVSVRSLDGGYSGNVVLGARSVDLHGHDETPHVVKIGAAGPIGQERRAFERIESVLGNSAPRIADFADWQGRGALKYRYAAVGRQAAQSFQKIYAAGADEAEVRRILDAVLVDQLGRLYQAAQAERSDLLDYYDFKPAWADSVRRKLVDLRGDAGTQDTLDFPGGRRIRSILQFYTSGLAGMPRVPRAHYWAQVHGDLNGSNILVDEPGNVWLIDFFHAHRGHVLRDLAKLENDLLFIWTPIESDAQLEQALALTDRLLEVRDLGRPLPDLDAAIDDPDLRRAWASVQHLRSYYPPLIQADREVTQLLIPQIRYAVHTLSFVESNARQKQWALYTACRAAEVLQNLAGLMGRLRVGWLPAEFTGAGRLGLTLVPGRRDYGRVLDEDLDALQGEGVAAVLCLLARDEFERYGVDGLLDAYRARGFDVLHLPTLDRTPPSEADLATALAWIDTHTRAGRRVLVHCVGGLGRAGTIAACWLRRQGLDTAAAIAEVRRVRSPRAIETREQEEAIAAFAGK